MAREMMRATSAGITPGDMPGFGNDFETEALPEALPRGRNSPRICNQGLSAEQLPGTAFTTPRGQNARSWCYRIRPSVKHIGGREPAQHDAAAWLRRPAAFEGASNGALAPYMLDNTMCFMFETCFPRHLTRFAAAVAPLQHDYFDCRDGLEKTFDGTPGVK